MEDKGGKPPVSGDAEKGKEGTERLLQKKVEELSFALESLQERFDEVEGENSKLTKRAEMEKKRAELYMDELDDVTEKSKKEKKKREDNEAALKETKAVLLGEKNKLQGDLMGLSGEKEVLRGEMEKMKEEKELKEGEMSGLRTTLDVCESEKRRVEFENEELRRRLREMEEAKEMEEINRMKETGEIYTQTDQPVSSFPEFLELQQKLLKCEGMLAKSENHVQRLMRMCREKDERIAFFEDLADKKPLVINGTKVEELEKSVADLKTKMEEERERSNELTNELEEKGKIIEELTSTLTQSEENLKQLQNEQGNIDVLKKRLADSVKYVRELEKKVGDLTTQLKEERFRSSDLNKEVQRLQQPENEFPAEEMVVPNTQNTGMENMDGGMDDSFMDHTLNDDMQDLSNLPDGHGSTLKEENSLNDAPSNIEGVNEINQLEDSHGAEEVGRRKRPSRVASKPLKHADSIEDSDKDGKPAVKKSKSEYGNGNKIKRQSSLKKDQSVSSRKGKISDTEMECPECEYRTVSVNALIYHLKDKHTTNLTLAGLALLCECGNESYSKQHSYECNIANFTVIRKRDGPIERYDDKKVTPQCILCEAYPKTANGYAFHFRDHHNSTLKENGIYLICSCGFEFTYANKLNHSKNCNGRQYTLHKLDEK